MDPIVFKYQVNNLIMIACRMLVVTSVNVKLIVQLEWPWFAWHNVNILELLHKCCIHDDFHSCILVAILIVANRQNVGLPASLLAGWKTYSECANVCVFCLCVCVHVCVCVHRMYE